jgi:hypothetical protein
MGVRRVCVRCPWAILTGQPACQECPTCVDVPAMLSVFDVLG